MKKILSLTILVIASNLIFAQVNTKKCITTTIVQEELKNNQEYKLIKQELAKYQKNNKDIAYKNQLTTTIPIVIHIVHRIQDNINSNTNISNAQIEDQLRILNEDYSKTNPEFPNPPRNTFLTESGNPQLKFCLASIDPNGNPTTGITRTPTSKLSWDADDNNESNYMKLTSQGGIDNWDPLRYLNIWVCNLTNSNGGGQTLGYAYLPGLQGNNNQSWKDGLVVDYQFFGTTGSVSASSGGRTATHEIGHYLGLNHTFCEETDAQGSAICCDNDNDSWWGGNVDDTPACKDIYFGPVNSNTNNNTCNDLSYSNIFNSNVLDMDENYMSYARDTWMFSQGQVELMLTILNASTNQGGRRDLWQNSTVTVDCSGLVDINESQSNNLHIYPNPTTGDLFISSNIKINNISVYNIIGKEVISDAKTNNNILDISQLSNGVYFIKMSMNNATVTKKIILSK